MSCWDCDQALLDSGVRLGSQEYEEKHWFQHVDLNDHAFYMVTCPKGHTIARGLNNRLYELLFDRAMCALLDGYYRESIATFASSLERFFEFYVRVVGRHLKIGDDSITGFWKLIGQRSERQIGAFFWAYLVQNKREFKGIQERMEKLRNDVVHKGIFATRDDACAYGEYVHDIIWGLLLEIQKDMDEAMQGERLASYLLEVNNGRAKARYQGSIGGMGVTTVFCGYYKQSPTFRDALERFQAHSPWNIGGYDTRLGVMAQRYGLTVRQFLRELTSGKYASIFDGAQREPTVSGKEHDDPPTGCEAD